MRPRAMIGFIALLGAFTLGGCSADPPQIDDVESLREAFLEAGGTCPEWDQHDSTLYAKESASCGDGTALTFFEAPVDMELMRLGLQGQRVSYFEGEYWFIETTEFEDNERAGSQAARKLGGTYVTHSGG